MSIGSRYFADATGSFKRECDKIIEASKTKNRGAIRKILSRYSGAAANQDLFEILRMHSLINASRIDDRAVVQCLVEEFGADPQAYNGIAMKEAVRNRSLDVLTYMLEYKQKQHTE